LAKGFQDDRYRELISLLVQRRGELGLSQSALAARLGTHQQFISRYETGERRLDVVEFCDIVGQLELNPTELIERLAAQ
jgi:transcriptional regulator with XRE-family HTH domain